MVIERLSIEGDLLDKQVLTRVMDTLNSHGIRFQIRRFRIGEYSEQPSLIELVLKAHDELAMRAALDACRDHGATIDSSDANLAIADMGGVLPENFYSTTNFTTHVRFEGEWVEVEKLEMDCGIRIWHEGGVTRAVTCPMHQVRVGDQIVIGYEGVRVSPAEVDDNEGEDFRFMSNEVSTERPKSRLVAQAVAAIKEAKSQGQRVLLVGGPAIIHTGCAWMLAKLIEKGWIDVLFAGNALAAHDIEAAMMGTSLGVNLEKGTSPAHGHTHHLRCINRVRRAGSIANAVNEGTIPSGVMATCVRTGTPFVLCGSIRDDGPLPDVITDNVRAQDTMREYVGGIGVALMVATTLHSVATGNILPASVKTYCVDSDADTVIKLTDRGTHQAVGIVTDCEFFLKELLGQLEP
jgi:lysine-ketoglutarate reductase/saccharopine dehydrogenase-like protein (TIGR00300 family)